MQTATFTRTTKGFFEASGTFSPEEIITQAESILQERVQSGQALSSPQAAADFLKMSLANEPNENFASL